MSEPDRIVFDLETKKDFAEVGGRQNLEKLEVSVLSAYSYLKNKFYAFEEKDLWHFEEMLKNSSEVIGFNITGFDLPVLRPYLKISVASLNVIDLMDDVVKGAGFRISLDNLSENTLGSKKSGHGLDAVKWFREGKIEEIKKYCTQDVKLTRDLYEFGKQKGHVFFFSKEKMGKMSIPVNWGKAYTPTIRNILSEAFRRRVSANIDYVARVSDSPGSPENARLVDIHNMTTDSFEAYCHLRKGMRIFKIDKVLSVKLTQNSYQLPSEMQSALL